MGQHVSAKEDTGMQHVINMELKSREDTMAEDIRSEKLNKLYIKNLRI